MEPVEGHVKVLGFRMFYRSYGEPTKGTVLCLHGGPGATHDYLLSLEDLAQFGYRVVMMDQLGCGKSERPRGTSLYTIAHNVEEVEGVFTVSDWIHVAEPWQPVAPGASDRRSSPWDRFLARRHVSRVGRCA